MIDLAVLIGKQGSVFKSVFYLIERFSLPISLRVIATYRDKFTAEGIKQETAHRKINFIDHQYFFTEFEKEISSYEKKKIIIFSWFDKLVPVTFIKKGYQLYNQHPSLLPQFPGMNSWDSVWQSDLDVTGSTIHKIDEGVDTGEIVSQHSMDLHRKNGKEIERNRLFLLQVYQAFVFFFHVCNDEDDKFFPNDLFLSDLEPNSMEELEALIDSSIKNKFTF